MGTTKEDISRWFYQGIEEGATHMIIVCDRFDYEDYPVYVSPKQNVHEIKKKYDGPDMQKVMEVYNLKMDKESQIGTDRSFNY